MADGPNLVRQHLFEFRPSDEFSSVAWTYTYDAVCVFGELVAVD